MADIVIIGAGAAGLMAANVFAGGGARALLVEKNPMVGRKLLITGKGRCNITNDCRPEEFMENVVSNPKFLHSAINALAPAELKAFFESRGVPLKTERGGRVFPASDRSADIVGALKRGLLDSDVRVANDRAEHIVSEDGRVSAVVLEKRGLVPCKGVLLCTGGASYPLTGSTGDGYRMAAELGHRIVPLSPSLVPVETEESWCRELCGLALENVGLKLFDTRSGRQVFCDFGQMLFTHFGVSGPMVLSASCHMRDFAPGRYRFSIDLKPALTREKLDLRVQRDFGENLNRDFKNSLGRLLPKRLIPVVVALSGIPPELKVNQITARMRGQLVSVLKDLRITVSAMRPIEEAIVTAGGVDVRQVNPKTMESKLVKGLYFAGEILDIDAYTGGFNLQAAFSTGYLAAKSMLESLACHDRG